MEHQQVPREDVYFILTSLLHVVVVVLLGILLNIGQLSHAIPLVAFAVVSKFFALVVGENRRLFSHSRWAALPIATLSFVTLLFLPADEIPLGLVVMVLYFCYPQGVKARERSPLDIVFHGTRYALLFWMGYNGTLSLLSEEALVMVFLFGVTGELLVGLKSDPSWRTTTSRLGTVGTVRIVRVLTFVLMLLGSYIFSQEVNFPVPYTNDLIQVPWLLGLALAIFIALPVSIGKSRHAPISVRKREIIALLLCLVVIVGLPLATRVNLSGYATQPNYTVSVGMQTIVTGPHSWDGQWIIFNYQNQSNYYYILLHTNGILELSRVVDGVQQKDILNASTSYSPFQWHDYTIQVLNGVASISIDGTPVMSSVIQDPGGEAMISGSFPTTTLWVVSVTHFEVSDQGQ